MLSHNGIDIQPDFEELVRSGLIDTYFSPVIDLATHHPIGYQVHQVSGDEAESKHLESRSFRTMLRASEMLGDVDASLREAAIRTAENKGLPTGNRLFINSEQESFATLDDRTGEPDRSVILQLDAKRIRNSPAAVLRAVRLARSLGWGVGMSNVGPDLESAAFLPLLNPSVVGLDPEVLRMTDLTQLAELNRLMHAHLERTEAVILAENVQSEEDIYRIETLGARLASGPYFGQAIRDPKPLEVQAEDPLAGHTTRNQPLQGTPFSIARGLRRDPLLMEFDMLVAQLRSLEQRALASGAATVVLVMFGELERPSEHILRSFESVRDRVGMLGMLSGGFDVPPVPGVFGGAVDASDPLREEYSIVVVGPDWAGLVAGRKRSDPGHDGEVIYEVFTTTDRYTCIDAARSALSRVTTTAPK